MHNNSCKTKKKKKQNANDRHLIKYSTENVMTWEVKIVFILRLNLNKEICARAAYRQNNVN